MLRRRQRLGAPRSLGGVTLLEMLVVSAILMVLATLIFPWSTRMVAKARQAACATNLRHLARAFQLYIAENNGSFFLDRQWTTALQPYIGREDNWWQKAAYRSAGVSCPAVNALRGARFNSGIYGVNYSFINTIEGPEPGKPPAGWPLKLANVPKPARAWAFTEAGRQLADGSADVDPLGYITPGNFRVRPGPSVASLVWPHAGGHRNLAFLDGHVEALTWEEVDAWNGAPPASPAYREFHGLTP